mmetsp:Transcript_11182/g.28651  ORF Transcript_11182/g.28651 Transcript_11182/m.28651 type:complete len:227 (+) Transcript_11182:211-891(+)
MPGEVRCQVRGCANDVSGTVLKRYRVCEEHLREPEVLIDGQPQRFCRQCRKFHLLNRFEGNNRNCLEKLLKHNHRRRVKRQQRKEVSEDDPQCFSSLMETFEESASDGDQSISPSLQLEFNRLRKLQRRYNPVSSSSLDNTASTAMYMADGMNAENSYRECAPRHCLSPSTFPSCLSRPHREKTRPLTDRTCPRSAGVPWMGSRRPTARTTVGAGGCSLGTGRRAT